MVSYDKRRELQFELFDISLSFLVLKVFFKKGVPPNGMISNEKNGLDSAKT